MGTWGTGSFDNDDAADFAAELEDLESDAERSALLRRSLGVSGADYLSAPEAQTAIAAAEVVAALAGHAGDDLPEELEAVTGASRGPAPSGFRSTALRSLDRVLAPRSELLDLWSESEELADWKASVRDLRERIARIEEGPPGTPDEETPPTAPATDPAPPTRPWWKLW